MSKPTEHRYTTAEVVRNIDRTIPRWRKLGISTAALREHRENVAFKLTHYHHRLTSILDQEQRDQRHLKQNWSKR